MKNKPKTWADTQNRISDLEIFVEKLYQHHSKGSFTLRKGNTQYDKPKGGKVCK